MYRLKHIHENIVNVRIEELKLHLVRVQRHEAMVVQTMKEIIAMTEDTRKSSDKIIKKLKEFQTGKYKLFHVL